jgi:dTDP-4-dehydrorhamnose reductase
LVEWALDNFRQNKKINGFQDVYFNPLYTKQLARIIKKIIEEKEIKGILNVASKNPINKYAFLCLLANIFYNEKDIVNSTSVDDVSFFTRRPHNTILNTDKFKKIIKTVPTVEQGLREMKKDYEKVFLNNKEKI